jgi:hypothetical protein
MYFFIMASMVPLVREYAYVVLRFKMGIKQNSLTPYVIFYRYGNTKDMIPIDGLVHIDETPIATGSLCCRQLIKFLLKPHERLCLFKIFGWFMDLTHVRINLYNLDVIAGSLTTLYRTQYRVSQLADTINAIRKNIIRRRRRLRSRSSDHLRNNMGEILRGFDM